MIGTILVVAAALALPAIFVIGALFLFGSAIAAIVDAATAGMVREAAPEAQPVLLQPIRS